MWGRGFVLVREGQHRLPPAMTIQLGLKKRSKRKGKATQAEETASAKVLGQEGAGAFE